MCTKAIFWRYKSHTKTSSWLLCACISFLLEKSHSQSYASSESKLLKLNSKRAINDMTNKWKIIQRGKERVATRKVAGSSNAKCTLA